VSSPSRQAPKHRAPTVRRDPRVALKRSLTLSSMAVVATGIAIASGSLSLGADDAPDASAASLTDVGATADGGTAAAAKTDAETVPSDADSESASDRAPVVTRSDSRAEADPLKTETLSLGKTKNAMTRTEDLSDEDPRVIAAALLSEFGWSQDQFSCLDSLWTRESNWNVHADNPNSSAYGIPQALPGSKMASAGADWATNPVTQIRWGLGYIQDRYGSPCSAWGHSQSQGFY
jgi:hypothetical protein